MGDMIAVELVKAPPVERKRCSDFDWECAHVMDHAACHRGFAPRWNPLAGEYEYMDTADGECPYLSNGATNDR